MRAKQREDEGVGDVDDHLVLRRSDPKLSYSGSKGVVDMGLSAFSKMRGSEEIFGSFFSLFAAFFAAPKPPGVPTCADPTTETRLPLPSSHNHETQSCTKHPHAYSGYMAMRRRTCPPPRSRRARADPGFERHTRARHAGAVDDALERAYNFGRIEESTCSTSWSFLV